ncbi:MAG TPA: septal ring lytic transglycosylase RlpA family protein [Terriglobales bacterium]
MRRRIANSLAVVVCVASLGAAGAAGGPNSSEAGTAQIKRKPESNREAKPKHASKPYQIGTASWYGEYFQGRETASGEPYDMHDLTAAHPTLPLGTFVRVTNLRNGRSVVLRVNDRGPVVEGRIIDVSYNAAKVLGFKAQGLQRVRLDLVPTNTVAMASHTARLP